MLALTGTVTAGCSSLQGTGDLSYVSGDGNVVQIAPGGREDPVEIRGEDLSGDGLDFSHFRGAPLVVNVWASWCPPCRKETPLLAEAAVRLAGTASFVGINVRDNNGKIFEEQSGLNYPSLYDSGGTVLLKLGSYSPTTMPGTLILDSQGRVAALISGEIPSLQTLTDLTEEVAAESLND